MPAVPRFEPHNRVAGKFRLRRRLATGGMGEVWVARNESTGADVALKVLHRGGAARELEAEVEERFRHEARLSAMLAHRNIVKVFDLIEEPDGTLVLVMELLRGETLQKYLEKRGPRSAREAVAILSPVLAALSHAHAQGIIHRDVTPSNIFLAVDPDGHVTPKLVDFGIAKHKSGTTLPGAAKPIQTVDGRVLGTPRYMAPERIRGETDIDGRADLFAAAVVLYETLTGASPFAASSPSASLAAVLERTIDPDARIDPRLWIEIQRAMAKRPYERHANAQELANALKAAVGETDGALEAALRRTIPPPMEDDAQHDPGPDGAVPKSIESVVVLPRKRVSGTVWLVAGGGVGVLLAFVVFALRSVTPGTAAAAAGAAASMATPAAAAGPPPAATETATATPTLPSTATPPPAATPPATAAPPAAQTTTSAPTKPPGRATPPWAGSWQQARPAGRPKPVATTPGF